MSPITHFLVSWVVADRVLLDDRDKMLVAAAGVLPDLDSLGVVVDLGSPLLGGPETELFATYHHFLTHGIAAAVVIPLLLTPWAQEKLKVFLWGFVVFHLHVICDLIGARGPEPEDLWPIYYLGPFTKNSGVLIYQDQWPLNAWPNVLLTVLLLGWVFYSMWRRDKSPLLPWAPRIHAEVVAVLRNRFGSRDS